jgi:lysyl-tRNA synthetase class 2
MSIKDNPLRAEKFRKLKDLREAGINPYPHNFKRTHKISELMVKDSEFQDGDVKTELTATIAGRLMTKRPMGKAAFFNVADQSGNMQCYVKVSELSPEDQQAFDLLDIGDIVGVTGYLFKTRKGELSLHTQQFKIICKSVEPLPEKYHGIADIEIKYRQRYLDLIMSPESRHVFETRSKIIKSFRNYLDKADFLEVETPVLQPIYGGAAAYPFSTKHRALDMKLFLKISPELYLKRLIVGGFEKVYEIGKNFRNEGIDRSHNPEFTMLEWYEAYTDYFDQMKRFEDIVAFVAKEATGGTKVIYQDQEIDFTPPWERISVYDAIKKYGNFDVDKASPEQIESEIKKYDPKFTAHKSASKGHLIMELFDHTVEPKIVQPTFIIDFPVEISPLTKSHRSIPGLVERFEPICAGMEIGNSYTELNDPEEQRSRLEEQEDQRTVDEEAQPMDEDFVTAIEVGMPPTGGVGIGIERIVMLLTNQHSIRDILLFPTMKPIKKSNPEA